jgi:basic membrane protein A and related proteins
VKRTARTAAALIGVAALTMAGCGNRESTNAGDSPSPSDSSSATDSSSPSAQSNPDFKACMVSDSGGFNDKSFNQTSHDGLEKAKTDLGIQTGEVESNSPSEFVDNIDALVKQDCDSITTVGFLLGDATLAAAKKNPKIDFSIVDFAYDKPTKNLKGLLFDTAEPSFLAGYLAAGVSQSGIVGTFGGAQIPSVTSFMDGFQSGIEKYNEDEGTDVQLIGWDKESQKGTFTNDFESKTKGQSAASEMITQGADIIFPVAGPAGLGALQAVKDADVRAIWVDTDGCVSAAEYCDVLLTSVMKGMDVAVEEAIKASLDGNFNNEPYTGTLENGGVGLAPYHDQEGAVPAELDSKIQELKQQIIDGDLKVQ